MPPIQLRDYQQRTVDAIHGQCRLSAHRKQRGGNFYICIDIEDALKRDIVRRTNVSHLYAVSRHGFVFRAERGPGTHPGKVINPWEESHGYLKVTISRSHYFVHRLVMCAFLRRQHDKEEINHIDGNKKNNSIENLEWVTHSENMLHAYASGLNFSFSGEDHHMSKLSRADVIYIKNALKNYERGMVSALAGKFGVTKHTISKIKNGKSWIWT